MANLDDIFPQEFVDARTKKYEVEDLQPSKPTYWDFLGELMFFGDFNAVKAVLDNYITIEQADALLTGSKKAYRMSVYDRAVASLAANVGGNDFTKIMKNYTGENNV